MAEKQTPREEFEARFGGIWGVSDNDWQWLKEFVQKQFPETRRVVAFQVDTQFYHPDDVQVLYAVNGRLRSPSEVVKILRVG